MLLEGEPKEPFCAHVEHVCKLSLGVLDLLTHLSFIFVREIRADPALYFARKHDMSQMLGNNPLAVLSDAARHQK